MQLKLFDEDRLLMLPEDLIAYDPAFLSREESDGLLEQLLNTVPWQQSKVMMYEKEVLTPRLSAWFGTEPIRSGDQRPVLPWPHELLALKTKVEAAAGIVFDGVLLNYYRDNNDSVAWHADKDTVPGLKTEIASISLGEERHFDFRSKDDHRRRYSIKLQHGSLLLMKGDLQRYWEHRIAKSIKPMKARINLTFRKVGGIMVAPDVA
ncbi:alpha-ketoglutarate-dependent dioxygenase AlkB family protein [Chitinophaga nivalis]|uniref:Alpha-ketoglutarate-dependent dioxygenase AlkB n=1 Tax=Chitinophaga nivalis TaxID=2991709 RepID=A0ABT3INK7_9BACT|nr:alpha-ketoglutarate-dependent dioxygenase AlkB [Chitinophaga nivalis]MCW3464943.1 alpha-ketoglutarate-dependent dioxygenase AlkB [Chitinophaga nivalis]MCW3485365.1 alpha-ketoglutarate-dependent dioxygenase AlkB [Chitinophaga nivalis]